MRNMLKRFLFSIILTFISFFIIFLILKPLFMSDTVMIYFAVHPFNICEKQPLLWNIIKFIFIFDYLFSGFIFFYFIISNISNMIYKNKLLTIFESDKTFNYSSLSLNIGYDSSNQIISIPEKSLYQNILITGAIGSGKTSSAMYPFTKQLIEYKSNSTKEKLGLLILDVKGNYFLTVSNITKNYNRESDLIVIDLNGTIKYNPLDKPNLNANVLADRLKTILLLFSPNNSEDFWLDKVQQILTETIKLCRLYNNNYVTFEELHNVVFFRDYYDKKVSYLKNLFLNNYFSQQDTYNLLSCLNFFEKEYYSLDERTISILKSEISRITSLFISDYSVKNTFCPKKEEINFSRIFRSN